MYKNILTNLTSIYCENTLIPLVCANCPAHVNAFTSITKVMSRQTAGFVSNSCQSNRGTLQTVFEETKLISHHSIELRESSLEMTNNPVQSRCLRTVLSTQPISIRVGHHQQKDFFIFKPPFKKNKSLKQHYVIFFFFFTFLLFKIICYEENAPLQLTHWLGNGLNNFSTFSKEHVRPRSFLTYSFSSVSLVSLRDTQTSEVASYSQVNRCWWCVKRCGNVWRVMLFSPMPD